MGNTQDIFFDRWGKIRTPGKNDIVKDRRGAFALCIARNSLLLTWQEVCPEVPELPGGGIEDGETPFPALQREFYEETGLVLPDMDALPAFTQKIGFFANDQKEYWRYSQNFYLLEGPDIDRLYFEGKKDTPEEGKAGWIGLNDLKNHRIQYCHRQAIEKLVSGQSKEKRV